MRFRILAAAAVAACIGAVAAPYRPASDDQVLERLPAGARSGGVGAETAALRRALARDPRNAELAVRLVERYMAEVSAEGDPRFVGYAQAALAPWWLDPAPPADVRVARAVLLQFNHRFDDALADLDAVVRADPAHAQAWAWIAAISMVRARYDRARDACEHAAPVVSDLNAAACIAAVDAATGRAAQAASALERALADEPAAPAPERLWALTRLAETHERLGSDGAAERAYRDALALGIVDGYLLAAYADFLLDRGRARDVIVLLKGRERSDVLLLRLAIAARAAGDPALAGWSATLAARFDAARLRGDSVHEKEEARFALAVLGDATRALPLAQANFAVQREPADARVLLEAALAARQPAAAAPALAWRRESRIESRALDTLAARLEAIK